MEGGIIDLSFSLGIQRLVIIIRISGAYKEFRLSRALTIDSIVPVSCAGGQILQNLFVFILL